MVDFFSILNDGESLKKPNLRAEVSYSTITNIRTMLVLVLVLLPNIYHNIAIV